jgi:acetylornithine/succinyldiaminopimelate/putrescine aminotransferase
MQGDLNFTVFAGVGGEAVDLALKVCRGFTRREKIISVIGGYHGHTGLALSTGDPKFRTPFQHFLPGFVQVPFGDIEALRVELDDTTAAVIVETIPATLGMPLPPEGYLDAIREACTACGSQMILDEVQTGLGRTGRFFGFEHFMDVEGGSIPDAVVLGKGLSGGIYPMSATCLRKHLMSVFDDDPFAHVSTFGGSEIGCRVSQKVIEISSSPPFLAHVNELAERWRDGLAKLKEKHEGFVTEVRQCGLFIGLVMKDDLCGPVLMKTGFDTGVLLVYAANDKRVSQILPPLIMRLEEVAGALEKLDVAIVAARKLHPLAQAKETLTGMFKMGQKNAQLADRAADSTWRPSADSPQPSWVTFALLTAASFAAGLLVERKFKLL